VTGVDGFDKVSDFQVRQGFPELATRSGHMMVFLDPAGSGRGQMTAINRCGVYIELRGRQPVIAVKGHQCR